MNSGGLIKIIAAHSLTFAGDDTFSYNDFVSTSDLNLSADNFASAIIYSDSSSGIMQFRYRIRRALLLLLTTMILLILFYREFLFRL